jgi:multidrug transporter EmrE-like cation transporter
MLVFPAFSIGTILLVTVCSLWFFRERLTKRQAVGLALIGAALALLNL